MYDVEVVLNSFQCTPAHPCAELHRRRSDCVGVAGRPVPQAGVIVLQTYPEGVAAVLGLKVRVNMTTPCFFFRTFNFAHLLPMLSH